MHLARDLDLDLDVVLKTRRIVDAADLDRLRREAGLLMRLVAHSGLPTVRSDLVDDDRYYMISDYIEGNDLQALLAAGDGSGSPLPTVLDLIDQLADTLDHLHGHAPPVVHGDVKPENVVVTADGRAVLIDFGAAMRVGDDRERLGTPGFSAPEVLAGEALTPAADVYSLAALTVFLLTGIVPKLGTSWPTTFAEHDLARLERIVRRGLTWDPLGRPWSASEFAQRLREAAEMEVPSGTITFALVDASASTSERRPISSRPGDDSVSSVRLPERPPPLSRSPVPATQQQQRSTWSATGRRSRSTPAISAVGTARPCSSWRLRPSGCCAMRRPAPWCVRFRCGCCWALRATWCSNRSPTVAR